ncbi:MAG: CFI-box-CTERM domain-containing protein [Candidatus Paceibacterota bacterium]|jgi:hypothetical protein
MSTISEEKMKRISVEIFDISKSFPGKIEVKQIQEPVSKDEIMSDFDCVFEAEYSIDDQMVIEKIKEIVKRSYNSNIIVIANMFDMRYELYSLSESNYSASSSTSSSSKSTSNSGCFIATAVYGSPYANEVILLKEFRDNWLLNFKLGKLFVAFYYWISPPIANQIAKSNSLKAITKSALVIPLIKIATYLKRKEN